MYLSPDLTAVIGIEKTSRPQVVKYLWSYIKDNNLQNPNDKRQIECDTKLYQLFKKKTVGAFEMNRLLSNHIFKPEDWDESPSTTSTPSNSQLTGNVLSSQPISNNNNDDDDIVEDDEPSSEEE